MDPLPERPADSMDAVVRRLEDLKAMLMRMDPEFFQDTLLHLDTILRVMRVRRAVEARSAREGQKIYWEVG